MSSHLKRKASETGNKAAIFEALAKRNTSQQEMNPFSNSFNKNIRPLPKRTDHDYGRPKAGSLTAMRGHKARSHVNKELLELCEIISDNGEHLEDGTVGIVFGELFKIYVVISNKVVGLLLRARKQGLVIFEAETLFQGRNDEDPILLTVPIVEIREHFRQVKMEEDSMFEAGDCPPPPPPKHQEN